MERLLAGGVVGPFLFLRTGPCAVRPAVDRRHGRLVGGGEGVLFFLSAHPVVVGPAVVQLVGSQDTGGVGPGLFLGAGLGAGGPCIVLHADEDVAVVLVLLLQGGSPVGGSPAVFHVEGGASVSVEGPFLFLRAYPSVVRPAAVGSVHSERTGGIAPLLFGGADPFAVGDRINGGHGLRALCVERPFVLRAGGPFAVGISGILRVEGLKSVLPRSHPSFD